jgi:D-beta-D-heptose 7-phosphate kinase/D-beta-D-heptose 1-phosphate adenosyltransferase
LWKIRLSRLIDAIRPEVVVKAADYSRGTVVGGDIVERYGGRVLLADLIPGYSTSATIKRLNAGGNVL